MKKIVLLLVLTITISINVNLAQNCNNAMNYSPDPNNLEHSPILTIHVNVHFILDDNCENYFSATEDGMGGTWLNGNRVTNAILDRANDRLENMVQNNLPNTNGIQAPLVPDARYRYELYTETNNNNDTHGGIWFHCDSNWFNSYNHGSIAYIQSLKNNFTQYGNRVIDIFFVEDGVGGLSGTAVSIGNNGSVTALRGLFDDTHNGTNGRGFWDYAEVLNHEITSDAL